MSPNNKPPTWRNSRLLFLPYDARALDTASGRGARSGLSARLWRSLGNWILRDDTAIIFDIYIQVRTRNHAVSQPQDFRKPI